MRWSRPSLTQTEITPLTMRNNHIRFTGMINYDHLDEMYETLPTKQTIRPSSDPVGSLTDNRRKVKPNRDGAHKRAHLTEWER